MNLTRSPLRKPGGAEKLKKFADDNFKFQLKMAENSPDMQKTLWEKEKLLVMSNFAFSRSVFKRLILQTGKKPGVVWERLKTELPFELA